MITNSEIYIIGLAILIFLIITFFFLRKITNNGKLKVKIEKIPETSMQNLKLDETNNQQSSNKSAGSVEQELVIFNLISMDRSMFEINQIYGFLLNYGAKNINNYFAFYQDDNIEKFRVLNALKPGTFEPDTKTFAIAVVCDLYNVKDPLNTVKQMIDFALNFSEKFYATLCDQERTPITKQMISHIESRSQDIARIKQLNNVV